MNKTEGKNKEVKTKDLWSMSSAELEKHREEFNYKPLTKKENKKFKNDLHKALDLVFKKK